MFGRLFRPNVAALRYSNDLVPIRPLKRSEEPSGTVLRGCSSCSIRGANSGRSENGGIYLKAFADAAVKAVG